MPPDSSLNTKTNVNIGIQRKPRPAPAKSNAGSAAPIFFAGSSGFTQDKKRNIAYET